MKYSIQYESFSRTTIRLIDETLALTTSQRGLESNSNQWVLYTSQSSRTEASPFYEIYFFEGSCPYLGILKAGTIKQK